MSDKINVISPDGKAGSVPRDQLDNAIRLGYTVESPEQKEINDFVDSKKGALGALEVGTKQFIDEALFGIPEVVAKAKLDPLEAAKWEALKKDHELANSLGGIGGFVANFAVGGPVFKAAAKTGTIAEKGAASLLAKAGIRSGEVAAQEGVKAGAKQAAKNIVAKTIEKGAQLGTEGAVIGLPMALTEASLGDTDLAAETLMWSAGLGGGLGVVFGGGSEAVKDLLNVGRKIKSGKNYAKTSQEALEQIQNNPNLTKIEKDAAIAERLKDAAENPQDALNFISEELTKEVKNADELRKIMAERGIEEVPGMLSASKIIRNKATSLEASPTIPGSMASTKMERTREAVQDVLAKDVLKLDPNDIANINTSKRMIGEEISASIAKKLGDTAESFSKKYAPLEQQAKQVAANEDALLRIYEEAGNLKNAAPSLLKDVSTTAKKAIDDALSAKTVEDITKLRTVVGNEIKAAQRAGNYNITEALDPIYKGLTNAREISLEAAGLAGAYKPIDVEYRQFKEFMKEFSGEAKIGRLDSRAKIAEKLQNMTGEQMVDKMLSSRNARATEFFAKNFPEEFAKARDFLMADLASTYNVNGQVQVAPILKKLNNIDSSVRGYVLGESGVKALDDLNKLYDVMPKYMEHNPSRTSLGESLKNMFSAQWYAQNVQDAAAYYMIFAKDGKKGLLFSEKSLKQAQEKLEEIPKYISRTSTTLEKSRDPHAKPRPIGRPTIPAVSEATLKRRDMTSDDMRQALLINAISRISGEKVRTKKEKEELERLITESMANPGSFQEKLDPIIEAISETGAPQVSEAVRRKSTEAITFLYNSLPKAQKPRDITGNQVYRPSDYELSRFNRRLEAVIDPMIVLDKLNKGLLTQDHVTALKTVYPSLYREMSNKVLNYMAVDKPKLNYQTKKMLSTLLQMPVDSTMSPESIMEYQKNFDGLEKPANTEGVRIETKAADRESLR